MNLIFEQSKQGRSCSLIPACDVPQTTLPEASQRQKPLRLPESAEIDLTRHYSALAKRAYGVNDGFYPLGSCTMKYNPKINDEMAGLPGFAKVHPLQPQATVQGCLEMFTTAEKYLCEITGMDNMTFQPSAGAHGEFAGIALIKWYHEANGHTKRTKIIVPDSAHGTNPASAAMNGFDIISIPSREDGCVDLDELRKVVGDDTAGLMLTNPNTVGLFDRNILDITKIVHDAGGLNYYDGANLNAVMGVVRPGDMGFDVVHLNLHKTFSTPHGGGGPGSGPVGVKKFLTPFLPNPHYEECKETDDCNFHFCNMPQSIGKVRSFTGNFLTVVRALTYILTLGKEGIKEASQNAVLNANYMMHKLKNDYDVAYDRICMHEFVISLDSLKKETGISAMDIAKGLIDQGIHPPTMYFPLIVHEALMIEPTETESRETMDRVVEIFQKLHKMALENPEQLHEAPMNAQVRRLDEVSAARNPKLSYSF